MKIKTLNPVLATTKYVVGRSREVHINLDEVQKLAAKFAKENIQKPKWQTYFHYQADNYESLLNYLVILDSLNFCFWSNGKRWQIIHNGKKYGGYYAMALSLKRFFEKSAEKANFNYLSNISYKEFVDVLSGGSNLFFMKKRWQIIKIISAYLVKNYGGSFLKFIKSARCDAHELALKIANELYSFNDCAIYKNRKVCFSKRAQILVSDIYGASSAINDTTCEFVNINCLTAFADYKLPQVLRHFGILEYGKKLEWLIKNKKVITAGSEKEIEIRANTIWAVEYLKNELRKLGREFHSFELDWLLWNMSQNLKIKPPHHRTKSIYY